MTRDLDVSRAAVILHNPLATMALAKRFVYILKNNGQPLRYYTGLTGNIQARLAAHNNGRCRHTKSGVPWHLDVVIEFSDERRAVAFEKYLKSGSGSAFANRHFR
jgi:predicted GIY-YIG superfamily endonuclease